MPSETHAPAATPLNPDVVFMAASGHLPGIPARRGWYLCGQRDAILAGPFASERQAEAAAAARLRRGA